jgi:ElaB/YqjD/DUF883 family membrane-anchored ribosome-binding protein
MTSQFENEDNLRDEFRRLGDNLKETFQAAKRSSEYKKLRSDIEHGFSQLGQALNEIMEEIAETPAAKQMQADAEDFSERLRSGEIEHKARVELAKALEMVNSALDKTRARWEEPANEDEDNLEDEA